jgi:hypothetical protein
MNSSKDFIFQRTMIFFRFLDQTLFQFHDSVVVSIFPSYRCARENIHTIKLKLRYSPSILKFYPKIIA